MFNKVLNLLFVFVRLLLRLLLFDLFSGIGFLLHARRRVQHVAFLAARPAPTPAWKMVETSLVLWVENHMREFRATRPISRKDQISEETRNKSYKT